MSVSANPRAAAATRTMERSRNLILFTPRLRLRLEAMRAFQFEDDGTIGWPPLLSAGQHAPGSRGREPSLPQQGPGGITVEHEHAPSATQDPPAAVLVDQEIHGAPVEAGHAGQVPLGGGSWKRVTVARVLGQVDENRQHPESCLAVRERLQARQQTAVPVDEVVDDIEGEGRNPLDGAHERLPLDAAYDGGREDSGCRRPAFAPVHVQPAEHVARLVKIEHILVAPRRDAAE